MLINEVRKIGPKTRRSVEFTQHHNVYFVSLVYYFYKLHKEKRFTLIRLLLGVISLLISLYFHFTIMSGQKKREPSSSAAKHVIINSFPKIGGGIPVW